MCVHTQVAKSRLEIVRYTSTSSTAHFFIIKMMDRESERILASVRAQRDKFLDDGVSALTFFVGVFNLAFSSFFAGRFPQHYWCARREKKH